MKALRFSNSLYSEKNHIKVLVFVPHQDDEINVAANLIKILSDNHCDIKIVYSTNGDWKYPAEQRFKEGIDACSKLGVNKENVVFLGYGDSLNNQERNHMFYADSEPSISQSGHHETYGAYGISDYSFMESGEHRPYVYASMVEDLKTIMEKELADILVCVDFDQHCDHRALSIAFDQALNAVLNLKTDYRPEVFKRYAYCLAYCAEADYFDDWNNPQTKYPDRLKIARYEYENVDTSFHIWNDRLRIPNARGAYERSLRKNIMARALCCHRSQHIILKAESIINSDEVFWIRRTDNLGREAHVTSTSGNSGYVRDFLILNTKDIDSDIPSISDNCWLPDSNDPEKKLFFSWDRPQSISEIRVYPNLKPVGQIKRLKVSFDNGYSIEIGPFSRKGAGIKTSFEKQKGINSCCLQIVEAEGEQVGITECEFYENCEYESAFPPFVKIMVNDNFAYNYYAEWNEKELSLSTYCFGISEIGPIRVIQGKSEIKDGIILWNKKDKKITVRISGLATKDGKKHKVYDQVVLYRLSLLKKMTLKISEILDRIWLRAFWLDKKYYAVRWVFKTKGIQGVLNKLKRVD